MADYSIVERLRDVARDLAWENELPDESWNSVSDAIDTIEALAVALEETKTAIINCRDKATFSNKDTVVRYMVERLPSIDAALAKLKGETL